MERSSADAGTTGGGTGPVAAQDETAPTRTTGGIAPGTEIGGYTIVHRLGSGGMGTVYRAEDGGGSPVAIKLLHAHVDADANAQGRERLRREAVALQRLDHPAIAAILDVELEGADAFIVTELVDGVSLEEEITERGALDPLDLLALADQLAEALRVVHAAGVVHRDLKPSNVLITAQGPVLIDFGIAHGLEDARVTSTGLVMGTPGYLAPELLAGAEPTPASDWWGWAALLAFAATGRAPFGTRPVDVVLDRARAGDADLDGLGARTRGALTSALQPEVRRRLGPDQVLRALTRAAEEGDPVAEGAPTAAVVIGAATEIVARDGSTRAVETGGAPEPVAEEVAEPVVMPPSIPVGGGTWHAPGEPAVPTGQDGAPAPMPASYAPAAYERPRHPYQRWFLAIIGVALVLLAGSKPGVAFALLAVIVVLSRWVGVSAESLHSRRERRGRSTFDGARIVLLSPVFLLRAALGSIGGLLVGACVAVLVVVGGWWALEPGRVLVSLDPSAASRSAGGRNEDWVYVALLCFGMALAVVLAWFGPMSRTTREGARTALGRLAPGWVGTAVLIAVALSCAIAAAIMLSAGGPIDWWPFSGPPNL